MSFYNKALELAEKGFYVFPLQINGKKPILDNYPELATRDPGQIKKWWMDPVLEIEQPYNIGISTTRYNGNQALVVVDVDNKGEKKGSDELLKMELQGYDFVETATQVTPTGGLHLVYRAKEPVKQGANVFAKGLDVRSRGGYIVGEGSIIDGKPYAWKESFKEPAPAPEWLIQYCGRAIEKESIERPDKEVDPERARARAIRYLAENAPLAIEGQSGDETTFKVAAYIKDFGVTDAVALDIMLEHWNPRCQPPWDPSALKVKVQNAFSYGTAEAGKRAPEHDFTPIESNKKSYLQEMNEEYAVLFNEGECAILHETVDEAGRPKRVFLKEATFKRKFSPYNVQQGKGYKSKAEVWLDWEGRREFQGLCFLPEQTPKNGYYNLWRGFPVKEIAYADAGASARLGFDMFIEHVKINVCGGDDRLFTWLMGYFAHLIQKPYDRPQVTLAFRGSKGVGKNVLLDRVGKLLGHSHYLVAHDSRYLTSNFNGHMDSCLMLVLDEAFWSGDRAAESKLKGITTAPEIMIERKGKEPYMVKNLVRLVIVGNDDWIVPASADERRYAVFEVGEGKKQNQEYFGKLCDLMDKKGGAEILMHYLRHFDLKMVNINKAPATEALAQQKLNSLTVFEQFWFQCLLEGHLIYSENKDWVPDISKDDLRRSISLYCKERNIKSWVPNEVATTVELKKVTPSVKTGQKVRLENGSYARCYRFNPLEQVRKEWTDRYGVIQEW